LVCLANDPASGSGKCVKAAVTSSAGLLDSDNLRVDATPADIAAKIAMACRMAKAREATCNKPNRTRPFVTEFMKMRVIARFDRIVASPSIVF
jgi:hypothetical protein